MSYIPGTTSVQVFIADRERLAALARQLTADGPGRFGQRETVRWLLDQREQLVADLAYAQETIAEANAL